MKSDELMEWIKETERLINEHNRLQKFQNKTESCLKTLVDGGGFHSFESFLNELSCESTTDMELNILTVLRSLFKDMVQEKRIELLHHIESREVRCKLGDAK